MNLKQQQLRLFLSGTGKDPHGRTLDTILSFGNSKLESTHNYIQWLFPTDTPSRFTSSVVLDGDALAAFCTDEDIRRNVQRGYGRMMEFYGFERTADGLRLEEGKRLDWICPRNHNFLRLTRILRCCTLLRLDEEREELYGILMELANKYPCMKESVPFWRKAIEPKVVV